MYKSDYSVSISLFNTTTALSNVIAVFIFFNHPDLYASFVIGKGLFSQCMYFLWSQQPIHQNFTFQSRLIYSSRFYPVKVLLQISVSVYWRLFACMNFINLVIAKLFFTFDGYIHVSHILLESQTFSASRVPFAKLLSCLPSISRHETKGLFGLKM